VGGRRSQRATSCASSTVSLVPTTSGAFASPERGHLGRCREISNSRGAGGALLRPRGLQSLNTGHGISVLEAEVPIFAYGSAEAVHALWESNSR